MLTRMSKNKSKGSGSCQGVQPGKSTQVKGETGPALAKGVTIDKGYMTGGSKNTK